MWLVSSDVTGERDESRIGVGAIYVIDPAGEVVAQVRTGTTGMAIVQIDPQETATATSLRNGPRQMRGDNGAAGVGARV